MSKVFVASIWPMGDNVWGAEVAWQGAEESLAGREVDVGLRVRIRFIPAPNPTASDLVRAAAARAAEVLPVAAADIASRTPAQLLADPHPLYD